MLVVDQARYIISLTYDYTKRFVRWVYAQLYYKPLVHTLITLSLFGLIPGGWFLGIPLLAFYSLVRMALFKYFNPTEFKSMYGTIKSALRKKLKDINDVLTPDYCLHYCLDNPWAVAKFMAAFMIYFTCSMPLSFLCIYGMYRFSYEKWKKVFAKSIDGLFNFTKRNGKKINEKWSFKSKCIAIGLVSVPFVLFSSAVGTHYAVLEIVTILLEVCAASVGLNAFMRDFGYVFKNPIKGLTEHPGKIYGLAWGRWLAFLLFPGNIVGNLGPAVGQVEQSGLLSSIFGVIFPVSRGWFTLGNGLSGLLYARISSFFNSIITSIFFSHNMRLAGDFYGVVGPTSFQIFICMALGCFLGYLCEQTASLIYETAVYDKNIVHHNHAVQKGISASNIIADFLYRHRWNIAFISSITPLMMASAGSAPLIAFAYESTVLASAMVASGAIASIAMLEGFFHAARRAYRYTFHPNETVEPTSRQRNTRQRKKESGPTIQLNETEPTLLNQARQRKKSVGPSQTPALRRNPPRSARQRH